MKNARLILVEDDPFTRATLGDALAHHGFDIRARVGTAFDAIEAAGDISPSLVAGGIKVALLTTVFGLIAAMILQIFYNLIIAMIDNLVNKMEDASITFLDLVAEHTKK